LQYASLILNIHFRQIFGELMSFSKRSKTHSTIVKKYSDLYRRYGPWAILTGVSSRLGKEFSRHLAQEGLNLILVSSRGHLIEDLATDLMSRYQIQTMVLTLDLKEESAMEDLIRMTQHLEIGLWVCSAPYGGSSTYDRFRFQQDVRKVKNEGLSLLTNVWQTQISNRKSRAGLLLMTTLGSFKGTTATPQELAANAYVVSLARELNDTIRSIGVDVLAVAPALLSKDLHRKAHPQLGLSTQLPEVVHCSLKYLGRSNALNPNWFKKVLDGSLKNLPKWRSIKEAYVTP
jgi:short-subunit dehydrogenase